jgi:hypothetical protein
MSNDNGSKKVPGYVAFAIALSEQFQRLGIPMVPIAEEGAKDGLRGPVDWVCFEVVGTGDKLYCNRTKNGPSTAVETTVPFERIPTEAVAKDMRGLNGKIEARIKPDVELIAARLLPVLAERREAGEKLRPSKAPVRASAQA